MSEVRSFPDEDLHSFRESNHPSENQALLRVRNQVQKTADVSTETYAWTAMESNRLVTDHVQQIYDNFADNLRLIVNTRYSRQGDFAKEIEVDQSQLSKWLTGQRKPELATAILLAQHLEISVEQLCGDPSAVQQELGFG